KPDGAARAAAAVEERERLVGAVMRANSRLVVLAASALFVFAACLAFAQAPGITVQNTAQFVGDGRYNWKVFLAAPPSTLQSISYVEYTLYPTVTNPVQRRNNPADGFALQSNGRGEFNIAVKVVFKDGRKAPLQLTHYLSLQSGRAAAVKPDHSTAHGVLRTGNTSQPIGTGRWDFQIYIEGDERTLGDVKCVTYTLH